MIDTKGINRWLVLHVLETFTSHCAERHFDTAENTTWRVVLTCHKFSVFPSIPAAQIKKKKLSYRLILIWVHTVP